MSETKWNHALQRRFDHAVGFLAEISPRGYLLAATALAVAGYAWLLMFPWLVLAGVSGAYQAVIAQPTIAWSHLLLWTVVAAGAALVTFRMARFSPTLPAGLELDRKKAPALFEPRQ